MTEIRPQIAPSATNIPEFNKSILSHIDKFMKSASISAYKKGIQNVAIISCFYSLNISQNNIKDYIYANSGKSTKLLVPLLHETRIVLVVFFYENTRVEYYDSLKQNICDQFHVVKDEIEKLLGLRFILTDQNLINESINDNLFPLLANVHICRIAEELCFLKNYQKLTSFDINVEAIRIKKIMDTVSNQGWNGEWIFKLSDVQFGDAFEKIKNVTGTSTSNSNSSVSPLSNLVNNFVEINNEEVTVVSLIPQIQREQNINSIIDEVVNSVKKKSRKNVASSKRIRTAETRTNKFANQDGTRAQACAQVSSPLKKFTSLLNNYEKQYPVLSQMLKFYSNLTKLRFTTYKNKEITVAFQKTFNWKLYSDLNGFEKEKGNAMLKNFPYFVELSQTDKSFLLQRFWSPFWFFERIYDTLETLDPSTNGNFMMLQDKSTYDLDAIINDANFENLKEWQKLVFKFWRTLMALMKEIKPDIIEIMYIFCCILWNLEYLNIELSEGSVEIVRRGRMLIHKEIREYYDYDNEKWNRIYELRNMLILTENSVKEYKKVL